MTLRQRADDNLFILRQLCFVLAAGGRNPAELLKSLQDIRREFSASNLDQWATRAIAQDRIRLAVYLKLPYVTPSSQS
jgi:hypothetical protein